ncbi:hypothetical protein [Dysgonomonas termitidis]|uniref:KOW domain-containing protein n=1 Tax=Dysgonomonas termitidis TaxID=1516126 RepID=A0ABV9KRA9_9BACT
MKAIQIGERVEIVAMPEGSFYKKVKGIVTEIKNGFVTVQADEVMSKWGNEYKKHPSTCSTAGRIENVIIL